MRERRKRNALAQRLEEGLREGVRFAKGELDPKTERVPVSRLPCRAPKPELSDFEGAARHVLEKNAELYRRLNGTDMSCDESQDKTKSK